MASTGGARASCLGCDRAGPAPSRERSRAPTARSGAPCRVCTEPSGRTLTSRSPVAAQRLAVLLVRVPVDQPLAGLPTGSALRAHRQCTLLPMNRKLVLDDLTKLRIED